MQKLRTTSRKTEHGRRWIIAENKIREATNPEGQRGGATSDATSVGKEKTKTQDTTEMKKWIEPVGGQGTEGHTRKSQPGDGHTSGDETSKSDERLLKHSDQ